MDLLEQNSDEKPVAIFLMGPTAAGKTDLAITLSEELNCELISVDSALIYRGMDIGTAKPDSATLRRAPHALIDIKHPWESYSVADFYTDVLSLMQDITSRGKIPLLVGGTMMYFRVLRDGIAALPSADNDVRAKINADAKQHGWPYIHTQLQEVDPESAKRIKPTDSQRLQRALEVFRVSGKTMTEYWRDQKASEETQASQKGDAGNCEKIETGNAGNSDYTKLSAEKSIGGGSARQSKNDENGLSDDPNAQSLPGIPYRIVSLAIAPEERAELHRRIELRFDMMLDQGVVAEVEALKADPKIEREMPSMRCVGYRQIWDYLEGDVDFDTMREKGIVATRQLAKRQLTWLRSWDNLHWLDTCDRNVLDKALKIIKKDALSGL